LFLFPLIDILFYATGGARKRYKDTDNFLKSR
jgi:hypothetical protein